MTAQDRVRFDEQGVAAIAGRLERSADDADHQYRRILGNLEFGPRAAGARYRAGGAVVEEGYRRIRSAFGEWAAAMNAQADELRSVSAGYAERDADVAQNLNRLSGKDALTHLDRRPQ